MNRHRRTLTPPEPFSVAGAAGSAWGVFVIKGLVYLTGFVTIGLVACVVAVAHKVHEWPWGEYVREGSGMIADKLDPRGHDSARDGGRDGSGQGQVSHPDGESTRRWDGFASPAADSGLARHTVRRGDTLYALSKLYYDDPLFWRRIARANDIRTPSDMRAGRVIVIPSARPEGARTADGDGRGRNDDRLYDLKLAMTPAFEVEEAGPGGDEK